MVITHRCKAGADVGSIVGRDHETAKQQEALTAQHLNRQAHVLTALYKIEISHACCAVD